MYHDCRAELDADSSFKERVRWGDPMAHLARKKLAETGPPPPVLSAAQQKKSGAQRRLMLLLCLNCCC